MMNSLADRLRVQVACHQSVRDQGRCTCCASCDVDVSLIFPFQPKITIALLDQEELRPLAHLMNCYPSVLKEKAMLVVGRS